ncbi:hypothetical protein PIB30_089453, partial [Stylosanthes scabra]|nr:hypothetical protein [Stylosanthes scabra]
MLVDLRAQSCLRWAWAKRDTSACLASFPRLVNPYDSHVWAMSLTWPKRDLLVSSELGWPCVMLG